MGNFGRVLRLTLRYRFTFVASVLCALGVAVLWGGNIGAIYPVLQVAFKGQSLQDWASEEIQKSTDKLKTFQTELADLQQKLPQAEPNAQPKIQATIDGLETQINAEEWALWTCQHAKPFIDRYLPGDPFATLALVVGLLMLGTAIKDLFLIANSILVARLSELATLELRKEFYRRTLRMDLATFTNEGTSDLMSRFTHDTSNIANGLQALFGKFVREPLKAVACLVGAGVICWRLLLLTLLVAPPAAIAIRWLAKTLKRVNRRAMEGMAEIYSTLDETFRGIKVVKAFTMERYERRRFHATAKDYFRKSMRIARYDSLSHPVTEFMGLATISLAMMAGAWIVMHGNTHFFGIRMCDRPLSLPALLVFYAFLAGTADPGRKLSEILSRIQQASAASDRVYSLLDREPRVRDPQHPKPLPRHHRDLVLEGVEFGYYADQPVLRGLDLRIAFGETIAIVGPNGCGKSTLANLIPRFADPTAGVIRLDGIPLTDVRLCDLRGQIGLVTQETVLFDETVYNNIRYGSPHATREQVIAAARQAHAHQFIEERLPQGYDTVVGQLGGRLSGGQRQRIALARAILRDPALIILDEATSQIDLESEQLIQNALEQFVHNRTAIIITHRLSILALATRIVVMDAGRIIDVGTHRELSARCPVYARLHQIHAADRAATQSLPLEPLKKSA